MTIELATILVHGPGFQAFNRSSSITVGSTLIQNIGQQQGLDVEFEIKSSLKPSEPNTCDLKIWGLSEDTRRSLEQASQKTKGTTAAGGPPTVVPVRIDAGYVGHTSTVFLGEMRSAQSTRQSPEWITELNSGDGDQSAVLARVNRSLPSGTTAQTAIQQVLSVMGVTSGNLNSPAIKSLLGGVAIFQRGVCLKGNAMDILKDLCASAGVEVSIQGGEAQFLPNGLPTVGEAYLLAQDTGLLESPTVDTKGILSCKSYILPGLKCGGPLQIESESLATSQQGLYRIISTSIHGQTRGNEWSVDIEAARYGTASAP